MSGSSYGKLFKITTWGESHGRGLGVVIEGCPAGLPIKESEIQLELNRRRTGQSKVCLGCSKAKPREPLSLC